MSSPFRRYPLAALVALPLFAGEAAPFKRTTPLESRAAAAAAKLRALPPARIDAGTDGTVPAAVRPLLVEYKDGLRTDFLALLRDSDEDSPWPAGLKAKFVARLKAAGLNVEEDWGDGRFGGNLTLEVVTPYRPKPKEPLKLVALVARFAIPCGDDALLAVYQRGSEGWVPTLRYAADRYEEIKGALGGFQVRFSPPDGRGNAFVIGASTGPWCTSSWKVLTVSAHRLFPGIRPAARVYDFSSDVWIGGDAPLEFSVGREGFSLKFPSWQPLNAGLHHRTRVVTVRVDDHGAKRLAPVAENPHDFLAEWFELDWADAKAWVDAPVAERAEALHRERHGVKSPPEMELTREQRCPGAVPRWVLGLETARGKAGAPDLFLTVADPGKNLFRIQALAEQQPADCPGSDAPAAAPAAVPK